MSVEIQVDPMNMEKGKSAWALEWKIIESWHISHRIMFPFHSGMGVT